MLVTLPSRLRVIIALLSQLIGVYLKTATTSGDGLKDGVIANRMPFNVWSFLNQFFGGYFRI